MPLYEYLCKKCEVNFEVFYKVLPSEKKQKEAACPDCDEIGQRVLSPFLQGNSQNSGIESAMGNNATQVNIGGRMKPAYRDANGQLHEVKSVSDIEHWQRSNQYGTPRMVPWRNPKTGETSLVPMRVRMVADPVSGEPMDAPVIRESVQLVPIDHFEMPSETRSGIPLDPRTGTPKVKDFSKIPVPGTRKLVDPETGRPILMGDCWGNEPKGLGNRQSAKDVMAGKQMSRDEAARMLSE